LERDPTTCEHRIGAPVLKAPDGVEPLPSEPTTGLGAPVLGSPTEPAAFPTSSSLGPDVISRLMGGRYVTVVGIFGDPESGKTACLASLYLMVSNAALYGWKFADSKSLMGFEDIARGAREWNEGNIPDQLTVHTELLDDRRPGFLHLRLVRESDGRCVDLALPDLPGEWTKALISMAKADRFEFAKSAEAIWIVVDGRALADREKRGGLITRIGQLAGRLQTLFEGTVPRVTIVTTHRDAVEVPPAVLERLAAELAKKSVTAAVVQLAPFSDDAENIKPGHGIEDLIAATVSPAPLPQPLWPRSGSAATGRSYLDYRGGQ
jgi:hypothetical protein